VSWCALGQAGHDADPSPVWEDRANCYGPEHQTPLSRYPSERCTDDVYRPDYIVVYAMRDRPTRSPYVFLGRGEGAALVEMTPEEAAGLRDALTQVLDEIAS
jgi:hypothetical protein